MFLSNIIPKLLFVLRKVTEKIGRVLLVSPLLKLNELWIRQILTRLALFTHHKNFTVETFVSRKYSQGSLTAKARIRSYADYWRLGDYEKHPVDQMVKWLEEQRSLEKSIVYYEIGANVGYSVMLIGHLLRDVGRVVAFEVEPTNFKTLSDNIRLNGLTNITALPIGVGEVTEVKKMFLNKVYDQRSIFSTSGVGAHSITYDENFHVQNHFVDVALMPLDEIIERFSLPKPNVIFVDAFGAEDTIIASMGDTLAEEEVDLVMVDFDRDKPSDSEGYMKLTDAGFSLVDDIVDLPPKHGARTKELHCCTFRRIR